jgi:hypothetical protein
MFEEGTGWFVVNGMENEANDNHEMVRVVEIRDGETTRNEIQRKSPSTPCEDSGQLVHEKPGGLDPGSAGYNGPDPWKFHSFGIESAAKQT